MNPTLFIFFIAFLSYGFYGAGLLESSPDSLTYINWIYFFMPIIAFILVYICSKNSLYQSGLRPINSLKKAFSLHDYLLLALIFIVLFLLASQYLSSSISNDSFAYATSGLIHVFKLAEIFIYRIFSFDDYYVHFLFQIISIALLLGLLLLSIIIFAQNNLSNKSKILILLLLLFIFRIAILLLGGNENQHPPMIGFPVLLFSSIFGPSDYSFKLSYFFTYFIFALFFYFYTKKISNSIISFITTISLLSLPGILFLSTSVEQSYWAMLCFTLTLILLANKVSYQIIFTIITMFCFLRSASIFACLPVMMHCIFYNRDSTKLYLNRFKELLTNSTVILLFLPFFLFSLMESPGSSLGRISFQEGIQSIFVQGSIFRHPLNTFGPIVLAVLLSSVSLTIKDRTSQIGVLFLLFIVMLYNFIDSSGHSKYQLEIISPFIIFFMYQLIKACRKKLHQYIICAGCLLILSINVLTIVDFKNKCLDSSNPYDTNKFLYSTKVGCNFIFQPPFDLAPALQFIRKVDGFSSFYLPGLYYGSNLPHILNKAKIGELRDINRNLEKQLRIERKNNISWIASDAKLLNDNTSINYVLIADVQDAEILKVNLQELGWKEVFFFENQNFLTPTYVMRRNSL